ncbi:YceI family protein [Paenibacillus paeoniae]|uniref:Polyisoprenoid-binding protein n=1 Tax=Paenibacillus paeoniae TaxID=2292705 RepID=A0A371P894_9BACL|nr:YceI family protein [Paenibacillus paeoniae]REK71758.1 polyisoprenoid-binding protein [Paenibacillus paeoniae]
MTKAQWVVDASHSEVGFSVRHLMIAKVKGTFHTFDASIAADPNDLTSADIAFTIELSSVDTRNGDRDAHLKSADFFDTEQFPALSFKATAISKKGEGEYIVSGDVSLHGVTRSESFDVTFEGTSRDPWGNTKAGFSATGAIKRSDYGLTYNAALETGGVMIGDEVKITLEIEALQQA